jgi:S-formylglutathione hydrolase FrmB
MNPVRFLVALILLTTTAYPFSAQSRLTEDSLHSRSLDRVMRFRVYAPTNRQVLRPVLILLHGYGGSYREWSDFTALGRLLDTLPVIVAMPQADTSWYIDAVSSPDALYETYLMQDFLPAVLTRYGGDSSLVGIAGLSMGGYGALVLGLRHPAVFRFIGALSASLDIPLGIPDLERNGRAGLRPSLEHAFGADGSAWIPFSPFHLIHAMDPAAAPYLYLANGIQDEFQKRMEYYRTFVQLLRAGNLPYEYHETPGRHDWLYWGREVGPLVHRFLEITRHRRE